MDTSSPSGDLTNIDQRASGQGQERKSHPVVLLAPVVPLVGIGLAWWLGALEGYDSADELALLGKSLRTNPLALPFVLLGFGIGTLMFVPVSALIAGTALAFAPMPSFFYSLLGVLLGATTTYWGGRLLGSRALAYLSGPRLAKFQEELCLHAFRASIAARLLPVGNFTVINVIAGSMRIPFRAFFLGNVVGALPGVLVMTFFVNQLTAALRSPSPKSVALLVGAVVASVALFWWLRRSWRRRREDADRDAP